MRAFDHLPFRHSWLLGIAAAFCLVVGRAGWATDEEPASEAIKPLLQERLAIAKVIYEQHMDAHRQGSLSLDQVVKARNAFLSAKLDTCESKAERIAVHEEMVKEARRWVTSVESLSKAGTVPHHQVLNAKLELLTARIALERSKAAK